MNKLEDCKENLSSLDFCLKSEIDIKEEPFGSDIYVFNENDLNSDSMRHQEQSSNAVEKTEVYIQEEKFETAVQKSEIDNNDFFQMNVEIAEEKPVIDAFNLNVDNESLIEIDKKQPAVDVFDLDVDNESSSRRIPKSQFPKVMLKRLNFGNKENKFVDFNLASSNFIKNSEVVKNKKRGNDRMKTLNSQEANHIEKKFTCSQCQYQTNYDRIFKAHMKTHSVKKLFKCTECDYECNLKSHLEIHLETHSETFKCSKCDYECNRFVRIQMHFQSHLTDTKLFKCTKCNFGCNKKLSLKRHMLKSHSNKCFECNYTFKDNSSLRRHLATVFSHKDIQL